MRNRSEFKEVVNLLSLHCETEVERRTLVKTAFHDHPDILRDINYAGSAEDFAAHLITILQRYGKVEPETYALWHLLVTLQDSVGSDVEDRINKLKPWANSPRHINPIQQRSDVIQFAAAALLIGALVVVAGPILRDALSPRPSSTPTPAPITSIPSVIPITPTLSPPPPAPVVPVRLQLDHSLADCMGDKALFEKEETYDLTVTIRTPLPDMNDAKAEMMLSSNRADVVAWGDCGDESEMSLQIAVRAYDDLLFETLPLSFTGSYAEALTLTRFMIFYSRIKDTAFDDDPLMLAAVEALDQIDQDRPEIILLKGNLYARAEEWGEALAAYRTLFNQPDDPRLRVSAYANAVLVGRLGQQCPAYGVLENAAAAVREAESSADAADLLPRVKVAVAYAQYDCALTDRLTTALAMLPPLLEEQIPQAYVLQARLVMVESSNYDAAFQAACHALQLDPRQTEAYVFLGRYYALFEGASDTALNALSQAAQEAPWYQDRYEAGLFMEQIQAGTYSEQGTRSAVDLSECDLNGG